MFQASWAAANVARRFSVQMLQSFKDVEIHIVCICLINQTKQIWKPSEEVFHAFMDTFAPPFF